MMQGPLNRPRLSQPKFAMDRKKMLLLQSVAVLLVIVAFMLLVYEYPIGRKQQVGEQTEGQAQAQAQGTGVQMQSMQQIITWRTAPSCDHPKNNFVFIEVNRAGSTTIQCMLMRYAYNHHLHVILPRNGLELKWIKDSGATFDDLPWADGGYNVIVHGMTYKWKVHDVMPPDTSYFSILRNPENHFKSMFHYYDVGKVLGITGKNQASKILKNPSALTDKKGGIGETQFVTSVRMSAQARDLGFGPGTDFDQPKSLENFRNITRDFGMMVILEHLSESLVLLRRVMCWELRDILYLDKAVTTYSYKDIPMGSRQLSNLKMINKIDFQLYDFFNQTLWKTIKGLGPEFLEEVSYYREVNIEVAEYCRQIETEETIAKLSIPAGKWTTGFMVHQRTCEELKLQFEDWNTKFIMRRNAEIRGESENDVTDTEGTEGDLPPPPKVDNLPRPSIPKEKEENLPPPPKVDTPPPPPLQEEKVDNLPSPPLPEIKKKGKKTDKKSHNSAKDILDEMNVPDELPSAPK
ncbi:galactosylceramide sulfotransferase-like isoform X1 [Branchiostoma floridae]|uniref:Galactosylceramide sulfotransferase-like isoform X1 n=2 Tax=Branchiostoma floridae TaxID=7739 RepID=A0A9J7HSZ2_BRAFL|nr:galactosylceramide sulfotransferase-like isoform X1 [Branchiostoma floridae]